MKKLLVMAIMAFLFLSSCADLEEGNENQPIVKNPITRVELSGKNNLVFK